MRERLFFCFADVFVFILIDQIFDAIGKGSDHLAACASKNIFRTQLRSPLSRPKMPKILILSTALYMSLQENINNAEQLSAI